MTNFRMMLKSGASTAVFAALSVASAAHADPVSDLTARVDALEALVGNQSQTIARQQQALAAQQAALRKKGILQTDVWMLNDSDLTVNRGGGASASARDAGVAQVQPAVPAQPVGEAPQAPPVAIASLPEGAGVLTPRGSFVVEPSIDYTHGSSNRLVFRGIEIVTGIQIGVIEASNADRDAVSAAVALRYGLLNRLEVEARVPYVYRNDRVTTLAQRSATATRTLALQGRDIGDVELAARYQINSGAHGWPVFVGNLRYKSDTGSSPFEIARDEFGIATQLATGSGFKGVEAGLSFLYPTDPAVIFGSISYLSNMPKDINKVIGGVLVGRVDPGDSIGAGMGFGFALNPRFSFSLGYQHNYIFSTESMLGGTKQQSGSLQVGAFTFGWSFQLTSRLTLSNTYEIGTTRDAPDMRVAFRLPYRF